MTRAELVERMARAYQDKADTLTVDEWQLDPRDCERQCATAALAAIEAAGCMVVPREATREMRWATWEAQYRHTNMARGLGYDDETIAGVTDAKVTNDEQTEQDYVAYAAMLAASPLAPEPRS
jgi:hypothetical protein